MTRTKTFELVCGLAGPVVSVVQRGIGWPGIIDVVLPSGEQVRVALHVSTVGPHHRKDYESRFQNPGDREPVAEQPGGISILLGLATVGGRHIFVATDGSSRIDRVSRFSILFNNNVVIQALAAGWAMYQSNVGERIYAFVPALLPVYIEMVKHGLAGTFPNSENRSIQIAISAAGILEDPGGTAPERARRAANVLIRDYAFAGSVLAAYENLCAMCGLDTGLVVGAHIMPAAAPGAPDETWNGLALCCNHHTAFDQHKIWVNPQSRAVVYRPDIVRLSQQQPSLQTFLANTFEELSMPRQTRDRPREEMFRARYDFYKGQYDWIPSGART